jgi:nucleotide-binding universal stress UspA family protein
MFALDVAATEAALRELALRIVYVREPPDRWQTVGRRTGVRIDPDQLIADASHRAADRQPGLTVEPRVVDGLPGVALIDQSAEASVTVVGHQGNDFLGLVAGSVCRRLTTNGHGAVMVARGEAALPADALVVVGVDVDAPAPQAIDFAFAEAATRRAAVRAVYACRGTTADGNSTGCEYAAARLADTLAYWSQRYPDVKVECITDDRRDPPDAILAASPQAGLIVVGSHDQTAHRRLVLGPVGDLLIRRAPCPVAIVHT